MKSRQENIENAVSFSDGKIISYRNINAYGRTTDLEVIAAIPGNALTELMQSYIRKGLVLLLFISAYIILTIFMIRRLTSPSIKRILKYTQAVASINRILITDRTARLYDGSNAVFSSRFNRIWEGEESIRGHHGPLRFFTRALGRNAYAIHTVGLSAADANGGFTHPKDNRV